MILPEPESDLRMSLIVLGNDILNELHREKELFIEELLMKFLKKNTKRTPKHFLDTITFLYSIGLIELENYKIRMVCHDKT